MIDYYQIKSPLTQTTDERLGRYIGEISEALREELRKVELADYLRDEFALLYVASGGSEGYFLEVFSELRDRKCYILTSGESNSLAASMEILSFLKKHGGSGQIPFREDDKRGVPRTAGLQSHGGGGEGGPFQRRLRRRFRCSGRTSDQRAQRLHLGGPRLRPCEDSAG